MDIKYAEMFWMPIQVDSREFMQYGIVYLSRIHFLVSKKGMHYINIREAAYRKLHFEIY